ncbi:unnamed protein product [Lasius platythorax]|uniref:Uncharacterized protein n=1 Tax=Lasius platythorax TaxID=488582 RepID=A0AAV2NT54_9HYME
MSQRVAGDDLIGSLDTYETSNVKQRYSVQSSLRLILQSSGKFLLPLIEEITPVCTFDRLTSGVYGKLPSRAQTLPIIKEIGSKLRSPLQTVPR